MLEEQQIADVVVEVRGGNVIQVYAANERIRVAVIDWDNVNPSASRGHIQHWKSMPLREMPADSRDAIRTGNRP